jgi:hypothetical protein
MCCHARRGQLVCSDCNGERSAHTEHSTDPYITLLYHPQPSQLAQMRKLDCTSFACTRRPPNSNYAHNRYYAEEMYRLWKQDPNSVHPSWSVYFSGMARGLKSEDAFRPPPNLLDLAEMSTEGSAIAPIEQGSDVQDHMKVRSLSIHSMLSTSPSPAYSMRIPYPLPPAFCSPLKLARRSQSGWKSFCGDMP